MAVLTPRAIIEGRTSSRPSTAVIIGLALAGFGALLVMVFYFIFDGAEHTIVATFMAIPVGVIVIAALLMLDRLEPEPPLKLLFLFLWGCGVAALIALIVNTLGIAILSYAVGSGRGQLLGASFMAPVVEETLKGSALLILFWRRRDEINGVTDCVLYAGMVAMGFAVIEDVNYFATALGQSDATAVATFIVRTLFGPVGHPAFTSATGVGVAYAATGRHGRKGVLAVIGGWCLAMFLHMSWNLGSSFGLIGTAVSLVLILSWITVLIVLLVRDRRKLIGTIQHYLPLYIPAGIVTPTDITMLSSMRTRRAARRAIRSRLGIQAGKAISDYQLAATELALLHASATTRTVSPERFSFRQQWLTYLMGVARRAFNPGAYPPNATLPTPPVNYPGPAQPMPTQSLPAQPMPTQPLPTQPMPTQPMPTQPMPTQPRPSANYPGPAQQTPTGNYPGPAQQIPPGSYPGPAQQTPPGNYPGPGQPGPAQPGPSQQGPSQQTHW